MRAITIMKNTFLQKAVWIGGIIDAIFFISPNSNILFLQ